MDITIPILVFLELNYQWIYLIVFLAALIEAVPFLGVFFPGQAIVIIAGMLLSFDTGFSWEWLLVTASAGAIIGDYVGYMMGRYWGTKILAKHHLSKEMAKNKKHILHYGVWAVIIGRANNITRSIVPVVAGSIRFNQKRFLIANVLGGIMWAAGSLLIGYILAYGYTWLSDTFGVISWAILGTILLILVTYWGWKKYK